MSLKKTQYFSCTIMRDFIWTLIIIWTIYQLSAFFRNRTKKQATSNPFTQNNNRVKNSSDTKRKAGNNEGEYVDFEEIK